MNTFAYCCASFGYRMARLARTSPILCPPATADTLDLQLFAGRDFVWFKLHGREGERYWYGDNWTTALSADRLAQADLSGAVVFVSNCWLVDDQRRPGPMMLALAQADPRAIIGGPGRNFALQNRVGGTDLLGLYFRFFFALGFAPIRALRFARARLTFHRPEMLAEDTLRFMLWVPKNLNTVPRHAATAAPTSHARANARGAQCPGTALGATSNRRRRAQ